MPLPPLPQAALQNNQGRWSDFFQSQGRAMPQVTPPQHNPVAGPPMPAQSGTGVNGIPLPILQKIMDKGGFFGGVLRQAYPNGLPQQAAPQAQQMAQPQMGQQMQGMPAQAANPMMQAAPQSALSGQNFFRRRMGA